LAEAFTTSIHDAVKMNPSPSSAKQLSSPPAPGPLYYEYRRAQWLTPPPGREAPRRSISSSSSLARLETMLARPGAEEDEELWNEYLYKVHRSLVGGTRLRRSLGLVWAIKILRAGWLRDGTWALAEATSAAELATVSPSPNASPFPLPHTSTRAGPVTQSLHSILSTPGTISPFSLQNAEAENYMEVSDTNHRGIDVQGSGIERGVHKQGA